MEGNKITEEALTSNDQCRLGVTFQGTNRLGFRYTCVHAQNEKKQMV